jgi:hypothetical protein
MLVKTVYLDLPSKSLQSLEELAALQGTNLQGAMTNAIGEALLRERVEFGVFRSTVRDYDGLLPDGSIRLRPCQEEV